jgi:hypothetical protein
MSEYQPDWSKAPELARFWTRDADGLSTWWQNKPSKGAFGHNSTGGKWWPDNTACPNWRETLQERPTDNTTETRKIREELAALTERLAKLEEGA